MKSDIILAGVGGQGILSIAAAIGLAAIKANLILKQAEVHGMSQRGGAVQSHLRLSDVEILSDLIPLSTANLIISVEPMESLRYLPYLSKSGWIVTNSVPFINIENYPEPEKIISEIKKLSNHVLLDANKIAEEVGSSRASNMVMLGAAVPFIDIPIVFFERSIQEIFAKKGNTIVDTNLKAFHAGCDITRLKLNKK
jgi:indolepyruvate ferredoxin oxidoreductase, beta subunit